MFDGTAEDTAAGLTFAEGTDGHNLMLSMANHPGCRRICPLKCTAWVVCKGKTTALGFSRKNHRFVVGTTGVMVGFVSDTPRRFEANQDGLTSDMGGEVFLLKNGDVAHIPPERWCVLFSGGENYFSLATVITYTLAQ